MAGKGESILIIHLREVVAEPVLRHELAHLLGLTPGDLVPLDEIDETSVVPYKVYSRAVGFRTTLELYVGEAPGSVPKTDLQLATLLARHYAQDAVISPSGADPFAWHLVTPAGEIRRVREVPGDGDDGVVIAADNIDPIGVEECWGLLLGAVPAFERLLMALRARTSSDAPLLCNELGEFAQYVVDQIKRGALEKLPSLFTVVELLLAAGTEYVQTATATCFLEGLQNISPDEVARIWVPLLGKASQAYCVAWDRFTGVSTPGLDE